MSQQPFTAAEVRRLAERFRAGELDPNIDADDPAGLSACLSAYSGRLEQDEQGWGDDLAFRRLLAAMREESPRHAETLEKAREEGRREILAEIARIDDPVSPKHGWCWFCGAGNPRGDAQHGPNCAWLRAQSVAPRSRRRGVVDLNSLKSDGR